jgi:hypothetical protein
VKSTSYEALNTICQFDDNRWRVITWHVITVLFVLTRLGYKCNERAGLAFRVITLLIGYNHWMFSWLFSHFLGIIPRNRPRQISSNPIQRSTRCSSSHRRHIWLCKCPKHPTTCKLCINQKGFLLFLVSMTSRARWSLLLSVRPPAQRHAQSSQRNKRTQLVTTLVQVLAPYRPSDQACLSIVEGNVNFKLPCSLNPLKMDVSSVNNDKFPFL